MLFLDISTKSHTSGGEVSKRGRPYRARAAAAAGGAVALARAAGLAVTVQTDKLAGGGFSVMHAGHQGVPRSLGGINPTHTPERRAGWASGLRTRETF